MVKNTSEVVNSRKQVKILVGLTPSAKQAEFPLTGKLVITCDGDDRKEIKWVYYLQSNK